MKSSKYPEAAFLAAMTGSATHEVRNVLAIIKESAGLMEDLILMAARRGPIDQDKVQRAVSRIEDQVKRGADLLTNLNRLTHTLDQELALVEMNEEVERAVFLSQRFARKNGHEMLFAKGPDGCEVYLNPFLLQMALSVALERCIEELPEGSTITVGVAKKGEEHEVVCRGVSKGGGLLDPTVRSEGWEELQRLAESLGAAAKRAESGYGIRMLFPKKTEG